MTSIEEVLYPVWEIDGEVLRIILGENLIIQQYYITLFTNKTGVRKQSRESIKLFYKFVLCEYDIFCLNI